MDFQAIISSAVVSAVITVIGSIIVAHISRKSAIGTAKEIASRELEKLERTMTYLGTQQRRYDLERNGNQLKNNQNPPNIVRRAASPSVHLLSPRIAALLCSGRKDI